MASCKDCLHVDVCNSRCPDPNNERLICDNFKDRSRFVELPRKIGDKLYLSIESRDKILHLLGSLYTDPELFEIVPEKQIKQVLAEQEQRNNTD